MEFSRCLEYARQSLKEERGAQINKQLKDLQRVKLKFLPEYSLVNACGESKRKSLERSR